MEMYRRVVCVCLLFHWCLYKTRPIPSSSFSLFFFLFPLVCHLCSLVTDKQYCDSRSFVSPSFCMMCLSNCSVVCELTLLSFFPFSLPSYHWITKSLPTGKNVFPGHQMIMGTQKRVTRDDPSPSHHLFISLHLTRVTSLPSPDTWTKKLLNIITRPYVAGVSFRNGDGGYVQGNIRTILPSGRWVLNSTPFRVCAPLCILKCKYGDACSVILYRRVNHEVRKSVAFEEEGVSIVHYLNVCPFLWSSPMHEFW